MHKGKIVLLPMFIIFVIILISVIISFIFLRKDTKTDSIFNYSSEKQIINDGYKPALDDSYKFTGVDEFGYTGDGQIDIKDNSINCIWFVTNLSKNINDDDTEKLITNFIKDFSDNKKFKFIKNPVLLQYCDDETFKNKPENKYKALSEGYLLFEYSYRDKDGVLWIVQLFSPQEGYLSGLIVKQIDEEGFEGYISQVDMRKG